jgi:hypothetical protein
VSKVGANNRTVYCIDKTKATNEIYCPWRSALLCALCTRCKTHVLALPVTVRQVLPLFRTRRATRRVRRFRRARQPLKAWPTESYTDVDTETFTVIASTCPPAFRTGVLPWAGQKNAEKGCNKNHCFSFRSSFLAVFVAHHTIDGTFYMVFELIWWEEGRSYILYRLRETKVDRLIDGRSMIDVGCMRSKKIERGQSRVENTIYVLPEMKRVRFVFRRRWSDYAAAGERNDKRGRKTRRLKSYLRGQITDQLLAVFKAFSVLFPLSTTPIDSGVAESFFNPRSPFRTTAIAMLRTRNNINWCVCMCHAGRPWNAIDKRLEIVVQTLLQSMANKKNNCPSGVKLCTNVTCAPHRVVERSANFVSVSFSSYSCRPVSIFA